MARLHGHGPAVGAETAPSADSVTGLLALDHRRLDTTLADAKRALAAGDLARAREEFAAFRRRLEHHIAAEEEILFPAVEALCGGAGFGPTRVMRMEHAELRALLAEIGGALEGRGESAHATPLASLTARLYAHNGKEERILYPTADRAASEASQLGALVARVRAFLEGGPDS